MQESWEHNPEHQTVSFSELNRYSACTQPDSRVLAAQHGQRVVCGADLLNRPLHDTARTMRAGHRFDTHKARAVRERQ